MNCLLKPLGGKQILNLEKKQTSVLIITATENATKILIQACKLQINIYSVISGSVTRLISAWILLG